MTKPTNHPRPPMTADPSRLSRILTCVSGPAAFLGVLLYLVVRPTSLRMFGWANDLGAGEIVAALRESVAPVVSGSPAWVCGSAPFALIVFAATRLSRGSRWVATAPVLAIGSELGQAMGVVPGTFDIVDLLAVLAAAALALADTVRVSPRPWVPAMASLGFVVLATGSGKKLTAEEKAELNEKQAETRSKVDAYEERLAKVHSAIRKMDLQTEPVIRCPKSLKKSAEGARLRTVHLPFLARFGADKDAWTPKDEAWAFLTDSHFDFFAQHASELPLWKQHAGAKEVEERHLSETYLVVVAPYAENDNARPVYDNKSKKGRGGLYEGMVFLVDQTAPSIVCQHPILVQTSESVDAGGLFDGNDMYKELLEDFEDNFEEAIEKGLPVQLDTQYGSIVRG